MTEQIDITAEVDGDEIVSTFGFVNAESTVTLRWISQKELRAIAAKAKLLRTWDAQHQLIEKMDPDDANRRLGRAVVVGWKFSGIIYQGKPLPEYSPESCDWLINAWGTFSRFVNETCIDLSRMLEAQREDTKKNYSPGLPSGSTTPA